ncbi:hypothetical protein E1B28_001653 [Marasmius oreades]|uniref:Uncharacterized protein n=1 Tax=Marasmius oreades TaxID=181124 RepID=A0A9P7V3T2_9AGAR|nr:uncharacterized protein E1B28_001653 [Marasmius oreades]KAG7099846.1 hypothetical protein E1B28_001653 [Marasmius oreades]
MTTRTTKGTVRARTSAISSVGRQAGLKSLIISPNLDALLEHEEQIRKSLGSPWSPTSPASGNSSPHSSVYSIDTGMPQIKPLSPPPRRNLRRPRTSGDSVDSSGSPGLELTTATNPYINPAPTLEQIKRLQEIMNLHAPEQTGSATRSLARSRKAPTRAATSHAALSSTLTTTVTMSKPPVPTSQKPDFSSIRSQKRPRNAFHSGSSPSSPAFDLPPTTNHLNSVQRSELVRKSRKLAQVFGQTPAAGTLAKQGKSFLDLPSSPLDAGITKHRHHRAAHSVSSDINIPEGITRTNEPSPLWPPPGTQYISGNGRRHSTPLSPDQFSFLSDAATDEYEDNRSSYSRRSSELSIEISSTHEGTMFDEDAAASFMDLSDGEAERPNRVTVTTVPVDDSSSVALTDEDPHNHRNGLPTSSSSGSYDMLQLQEGQVQSHGHAGRRHSPETSSPNTSLTRQLTSSPSHCRSNSFSTDDISLFENLNINMSPEEQAEEDKRRKREKLAKLHRFLGSRVPANLVIAGIEDPGLPPLSPADALLSLEGRKDSSWLGRRRSSSAAAFPAWSDDLDRLKDGLSNAEKAIIVRRAQKMEKMFGVAPPQTLYHTRHSPSSSALPANTIDISPGTISPDPLSSSTNYKSKQKHNRPGTAESQRLLLPKGSNKDKEVGSTGGTSSDTRRARGSSVVYSHYQHSLNSLDDILDRDDKASLAELHQFLNNPDPDDLIDWNTDQEISPDPEHDYTQELTRFHTSNDKGKQPAEDKRASFAPSFKSERRHSLPTPVTGSGTSFISLDLSPSDRNFYFGGRDRADSILSRDDASTIRGGPDPQEVYFQMRRRKAAKLTQFFGVDYRELIRDVLESIEGGLEIEKHKGTVSREEVEDLLQKLRTIKTKRAGLFS